MFSTEDTIVAIATPPGRGGIGVVRLSGGSAGAIAQALTRRDTFEPRHATLARIRVRATGSSMPMSALPEEAIDRVVVTYFPSPHSYTGDDVVEISAHGSPVVLDEIVGAAVRAGARLANPGEFTLRAYLNGRIDLIQAEAIRDLIEAATPLQARLAFDQLEGTLTGRLRDLDARLLDIIAPLEASLDFPEEGYHFISPEGITAPLTAIVDALDDLLKEAARGRVIREGLTASIVGRPNAGKSSLFNRLAGADRAIVTEVPGTTRDLLTERVEIHGIPFTLIDTAGLRDQAGDAIEQEGITRARLAADVSDVLIAVLDGSAPLVDADRSLLKDTGARARVVVASKADLPRAWAAEECGALPVSSITDEGVERLRTALVAAAGGETLRDRPAIANIRHASLLEQARAHVMRARGAAAARDPEELLLLDLHQARACFDEVTGPRAPDEILHTIFDRFCIGK
jgi:tRNA modification GTPase